MPDAPSGAGAHYRQASPLRVELGYTQRLRVPTLPDGRWGLVAAEAGGCGLAHPRLAEGATLVAGLGDAARVAGRVGNAGGRGGSSASAALHCGSPAVWSRL